jgi:hypothetical protein
MPPMDDFSNSLLEQSRNQQPQINTAAHSAAVLIWVYLWWQPRCSSYFAYSTARVSRTTMTLMWPG